MPLATSNVWNIFVVAALASACGRNDSNDGDRKSGTPTSGAVGEVEDTSASGIAAFLSDASYLEWSAKQPEPITSVAAHSSKTQTYFNDVAAAAARAGETPLPRGSVIVKDIFQTDGVTLRGKALMAKVEDGSGGDTWVWFEGFLPTYEDPYYGKGLSTCTGCHASGDDFVRTEVPRS